MRRGAEDGAQNQRTANEKGSQPRYCSWGKDETQGLRGVKSEMSVVK